MDRPKRSGDRSRADMVMVTEDALFGIEIKSDADTYTRLSRQVKDYNKGCYVYCCDPALGEYLKK